MPACVSWECMSRPGLTSIAAIASVVAATSCCLPILPFITAAGLAGGSAFLWVARPYLLAASILFVALGFFQAARAKSLQPPPQRHQLRVLWLSAAVVHRLDLLSAGRQCGGFLFGQQPDTGRSAAAHRDYASDSSRSPRRFQRRQRRRADAAVSFAHLKRLSAGGLCSGAYFGGISRPAGARFCGVGTGAGDGLGWPSTARTGASPTCGRHSIGTGTGSSRTPGASTAVRRSCGTISPFTRQACSGSMDRQSRSSAGGRW